MNACTYNNCGQQITQLLKLSDASGKEVLICINVKGILSPKCASLIPLAAMELHHITKYTSAKTVEYLASDIPQFSKCSAHCKKYLKLR